MAPCTHCGEHAQPVNLGLCWRCVEKIVEPFLKPFIEENVILRDTIRSLRGIPADARLQARIESLQSQDRSLARELDAERAARLSGGEADEKLREIARQILGIKEDDHGE